MVRALFGLVLVVHGLIHLTWVAPKPDDPSYPFRLSSPAVFKRADPKVVAGIGAALVLVSTRHSWSPGSACGECPGSRQVWRGAAIVGSTLSLLVVATFWHRWLLVGPILDMAIIVAAVVGWPVP